MSKWLAILLIGQVMSVPPATVRLYTGGAPRTYTNSFSVGWTNQALVTNKNPGKSNYVCATWVSRAGVESDLSQEVSFTNSAALLRWDWLSYPISNVLTFVLMADKSTNLNNWLRVTNVQMFSTTNFGTDVMHFRFIAAITNL